MLIARLAPVDSRLFNRFSELFKHLDKYMTWRPLSWFGIWTLFVAGMAAYTGAQDRFYFWDFSRWIVGSLSLILITFLIIFFLYKRNIINYGKEIINGSQIINHVIFSLALFLLGWGGNPIVGIQASIPYISGYIALFLIYAIPVKKDEKTGKMTIISHGKRKLYAAVALVLLTLSTVLGIILDDPVISTASIVAVPFIAVTLVMKHVRHVLRARVFPIFIIAMFVSTRQTWFLIPLALLFFTLRFYHYFRYQIICPTFGVDHES